MRILFLTLQLSHCGASPGGGRSRRNGGLIGECLIVSSGEIHLIQLELGGGQRGEEGEEQKDLGDIVEERRD